MTRFHFWISASENVTRRRNKPQGYHPLRHPSFHHVICMLSHSVVSSFLGPPWTVARQVPLSMGFPRQEYCSGLPFPLPGDLPNPGIEPVSLMSPTLACGFLTPSATWEAKFFFQYVLSIISCIKLS